MRAQLHTPRASAPCARVCPDELPKASQRGTRSIRARQPHGSTDGAHQQWRRRADHDRSRWRGLGSRGLGGGGYGLIDRRECPKGTVSLASPGQWRGDDRNRPAATLVKRAVRARIVGGPSPTPCKRPYCRRPTAVLPERALSAPPRGTTAPAVCSPPSRSSRSACSPPPPSSRPRGVVREELRRESTQIQRIPRSVGHAAERHPRNAVRRGDAQRRRRSPCPGDGVLRRRG
jgi:hypothetical protein